MAEIINEIIGKEAFAQIERMEKGLNGLVDTFVKSTNAAKLLETALSGTQGVKATTEQIKQLNAAQAQNEAILKKIAIAESEYGKEVAANAVRLQQLNTANKNAAREAQANEGSVNQMSASLIRLRLQYDAMSESLRKSPLGQEMVKRIQATDAALKAMEGSTGRFQRNVGDYKNQLFGLTQVFRELPGFTYSAQTGILGLSNNLPILADGFKNVAMATNEATGKVNGTMGALKIFASSIFSFGNIFAIAIGLFTIFSKEIFAFISGTKKSKEATDELSKSIGAETGKMETLTRQIENHNLSTEQRIKAAKELKDLYPKVLQNYSAEEIAAGKAAAAIMKIKDALIAVAMARAAQGDLEKLAAKKYENDKIIAEKQAELIKQTDRLDKTKALRGKGQIGSTGISTGSEEYGRAYQSVINLVDGIRDLQNENLALEKQLNATAAAIGKYSATAEKAGLGGGTTGKRSTIGKGTKEDRKKEIEEYEHDLFQLDLAVQQMNEKTDEETKKRILDRLEWIRKKNEEYAKMELDAIKEGIAGNEKLLAYEAEQEQKRFDERLERLETYNAIVKASTELMGAITDIVYNAEMAKIDQREQRLKDIYDADKKRIDASFTSQADKERELAKLEAQREAQQKRIDKDRIAASRKKAQQQKAYDIASIISGTAVAVVAALGAKPYTPLNIAIAAGVAATGAANLARAISSPLPQYAKGTDNHKGGLAIVGEKGTELVTLPTGQKFLTPATDTLMDLPKGTKVLNNEKLMRSVYNLAFQKLGNGNKVSTDSMQAALLESFNEMANDVKELKKVMINKNTNVNISD